MSVIDRLVSGLRPPRTAGAATVVEPMRRRDIAAVVRIEDAVYPKPWSADLYRSEVSKMPGGDRHYLVLRRAGAVLGYGGLMHAADEAHVTTLAVSPHHQRQGLASRLLAELAWHAVQRGSRGLTLEVRSSNIAAQALYQRFGFESAGVRVRYYENTEDAIVMWCHDIQRPEFGARLAAFCPEAAR
ncbi:MAG: ribosomal protein S18-alanine N-acetyltransferase [Ilumatobacteraceae bacterium]